MPAEEKQHNLSSLEKVETRQTDGEGEGDASPKGEHESEQQNVENKVTFSFFMTMLGLAMAFVVAEITPLFFVTSFTIIAFNLNALDMLVWILVAPYISTGAIAPFVGSLSDLMGRKGVICFSLVLAIISFILQGAAPNFACYLCGQVIAGAAIGIQILTVVAAASELVPVAKRGATLGYITIGLLPFASASLYGQLIAEHNWRYIYLLLGIWAAISLVVILIYYNPPPRPSAIGISKMELLKRLDWGGSFLSILGVVLFLIGINWGGQFYPWGSAHVICMLIFGVVTLVIFGCYERWVVKYPMFPGRLVQSKRHFFSVSALCLTSGINYVPLTVFWTIQAYTVYGATFKDAGVWLLPLGFCIAGGAIVSAMLITIFKNHVQWVLLFFCCLQVVGMGCMSLFDPANINTVWAPMIFGLIGVGAVLLPSQVVFSVISPDDLIGTSVALSLVIRMIGQVIGNSMFYNIFKSRISKLATTDPSLIAFPALSVGFGDSPNPAERIEELISTMTAGPLSHYIDLFPEINTPEKLATIVQAGQNLYAKCLPLLYYVSIPFGVLAILSCFGLWGIDKYMTKRVAVHL
ncbi:hypothetical protein AC578_4581 [Pseudocercospora eumusae]|uniref:Major facilitator superfamily (MFS) profile domain-containing protein n=1 Tax=Pseudocercospora eumusae TaxID=321146 RepID=A0A139H4C2_9PEZI|nr:hypothetical protein AC578_4581 [Pseudocercospora eumusae]